MVHFSFGVACFRFPFPEKCVASDIRGNICGLRGASVKIRSGDLQTLAGIVRGAGCYATPSPDRIERLTTKGLVKQIKGGRLKPTFKGRLIALIKGPK
jgi:hypothetical protein